MSIIDRFSKNKKNKESKLYNDLINKVDHQNRMIEKQFSNSFILAPFCSKFDISSYLNGNSLGFKILYNYYNTVSSLSTAIDKIVSPLADINLIISKDDKDDLIYDHESLKLLKRPNCYQSYRSFIKEMATNFLIAGNTFFKITGRIENKPLEIFNVSPLNIEVINNKYDEIEGYKIIKNDMVGEEYRLMRPIKNNCVRYVNRDKTSELVHVKDLVNDFDCDSRKFGVSKIKSLMLEIEQLIKAHIFNYSSLVRGSKLSVVVLKRGPMIQKEFEQLKSSVHNNWSGAERAGQVGVISNAEDIDIVDMSKSIKDMDYEKLKNQMEKTIYARYQIPTSLISEKSMTFNNLSTANYMLYDEAVLPNLNILLEAFNLHILSRYDNTDGMQIIANKSKISALEVRQTEIVKNLAQVGVLTQNELRKELGYEEIEGGDVLPINALKSIKHFDKSDIEQMNISLPELYEK